MSTTPGSDRERADGLALENAELRAELDASCNAEEMRQVRKELARTVSAMAELRGENAELREALNLAFSIHQMSDRQL